MTVPVKHLAGHFGSWLLASSCEALFSHLPTSRASPTQNACLVNAQSPDDPPLPARDRRFAPPALHVSQRESEERAEPSSAPRSQPLSSRPGLGALGGRASSSCAEQGSEEAWGKRATSGRTGPRFPRLATVISSRNVGKLHSGKQE